MTALLTEIESKVVKEKEEREEEEIAVQERTVEEGKILSVSALYNKGIQGFNFHG